MAASDAEKGLIPRDRAIELAPSPPVIATARAGGSILTYAQLFSNRFGPLPIQTSFTSHGGAFVFALSATAYSKKAIPAGNLVILGYDLYLDGKVIGTAKTITDTQHWVGQAASFVVEEVAHGERTLALDIWNQDYNANDQFNIFNLTAMEF